MAQDLTTPQPGGDFIERAQQVPGGRQKTTPKILRDVPERHVRGPQAIFPLPVSFVVQPPIDSQAEFCKQLEIVDSGADGRPLELEDVPRREVPPQSVKGR